MILADSNILNYAVGSDHPLRHPCAQLLHAHTDRRIELTTTIEVIQEFAHIPSRRRSREVVVALARQYAAAFDLVTTQSDDLSLGLTLYETYPQLGAFDAILAAVALNRRAEALVSADRAFGFVPNLRWVDPAAPALSGLLA